jgi:hypothetical protein
MPKSAKKASILPIKRIPEGPCAPPMERKFKLPRLRDRQAFELAQKGRTQAEIAEELGCSQATVCRAIGRVEFWRAKTLPEQRGDLNALEEFYLACDRQQAHLARLQRRALEDYEQSKQPVPIKKTITTTHKTNEEGEKVVVRVEEWLKPQGPRGSLLAAAERFGTAATLLAGGCVGSGRGTVMVSEAVDPDALARWNQAVISRDERIAQLSQRMEHLEQQLAVAYGGEVPLHVCDPKLAAALAATRKTCVTEEDHRRQDVIENVFKNQKRMEAKKRMEKLSGAGEKSELPGDEKVAEMHQKDAGEVGIKDGQTAVCGEEVHPEEQGENKVEKENNLEPAASGGVLSSGPVATGSAPAAPAEPAPIYRWSDFHRQEALNYHCQIHDLPPAKLSQASGIPDPARCTPKEAIERGYPYLLYIDRTEEIKARHRKHCREEEARRRREEF